MIDELKKQLENILTDTVGESVGMALTSDFSHGDLTTSIALKLAKKEGRAPMVIAEDLAEALNTSELGSLMAARAVAPGYVNVELKPASLLSIAAPILKESVSENLRDKKIVIEYSQPNIAKPMHFGHLRTTIIGESLKRIYRANGAETIAVNHLGDWGSQFGKLLAAYKRWGNRKDLEAGGITEMLRLYVKFHEEVERDPGLKKIGTDEFAKLERGDSENRELWKLMKDVSLVEFRKFYQRLGVEMDELEMGESDYEPMLEPLINDAVARGIAIESEGALVIPVGDDMPPCIIRKSDGATIYATRDLAQIKYRVERWHPDYLLYVVAADQSLHFKQVFRAAEKLGITGTTKLVHIPFGLVNLPSGKKMSTRAGQVIFLDDVLNESKARATSLLNEKSLDVAAGRDDLAEEIGVGAVKYQVLHQNRNSTIVFDWDSMLSLQGNTGPYLQYAYARTQSLLAKANDTSYQLDKDVLEDDDYLLLRRMAQLPLILGRCVEEYAPNILADYLFELAREYSTFYEKHPILSEENVSLRGSRLMVTNLVGAYLAYGLDLLGLTAPARL